jgi:hypothetical protein
VRYRFGSLQDDLSLVNMPSEQEIIDVRAAAGQTTGDA